MIINGERRWRAAYATHQIRDLKCHVIDDPGAVGVLLERLAENLVRDDFPPLVQAEMIQRLLELRSWSIDTLAAELGVSEAQIRRPLALLRLPREIQEMVRRGELPPSHAFEIEKAPVGQQLLIAKEVVKERLRLEETIDMVRDYRTCAGDPPRVKRRRVKFPFPEDRWVEVGLLPEDGRAEIRRLLHSVLVLLDEV